MDHRRPMPTRDRVTLIAVSLGLAVLALLAFVYASMSLKAIEVGLPEQEEEYGRAVAGLERDLLELDLQLGLVRANAGIGSDTVSVTLSQLAGRLVDIRQRANVLGWSQAGSLNELDEILRYHRPLWTGHPPTELIPERVEQLRVALAPVRKEIVGQAAISEGLSHQALDTQTENIAQFRRVAQIAIAVVGFCAVAVGVLLFWQQYQMSHVRLRGERYRQLFRGSRAVELLVDPDNGNIVDANTAACQYYGWDHDSLCHMNIGDINVLSGDELAAEMALARSQERSHFYFRHRLASGAVRDVEVHSGPLTVEGRQYLYSIVHDITERRQAEQALQASEHRYREVLNASAQGYWFVAPGTGVVEQVNDTLCYILGLSRERIIGRPFMSFAYGDDDRHSLEEKIAEALVTQHRVYEVQLAHVDGTPRLTRFHATTLRGEGGDVLGSYAFVEDITEQRQAERALFESRSRLMVAIQAGQIGIWDYDIQNKTIWLSPEWKSQLGFADDELPSTLDVWRSRIVAEDEVRVFDAVAEFVSGALPVYDQSYQAIHRTGRLLHLRSFAQLVRDEQGQAVRVVGARMDLTALMEAKEGLQRISAQQELILNSTADGLYGTDAEGRITFANRACLELLGYQLDELLGQPSHSLLHYRHLDGSSYGVEECPVYLVRATGKMQAGLEDVLWHKDGRPLPVELSVAPLGEDTQVGVLVSFRDVSERQKYRQELERSNQELAQFAYVVSHDLQEPLRAVSSYMTLLRRRYASALDDNAKSYVDTAIDGAMRMTAMIRDLLEYSRVGTRGHELAEVYSAHCVTRALDNLRIAITEAQASVVVPEVMPKVLADETQLVSLFQNLMGNAIKYRRPEENPMVSVTWEPKGARAVFRVQDNGIGIDSAYFERIFLPFQRLHTREKFEGNGIGLAICRKIVERHGGQIAVESQEGMGSCFIFSIPLAVREQGGTA